MSDGKTSPFSKRRNILDREEKLIIVTDSQHSDHPVYLSVLASMEVLWTQFENTPTESIQTSLETEVFRLVLEYQSACVCKYVTTTEQVDNIRNHLMTTITSSNGLFNEKLRNAAVQVGSEALTLFIDYCEDLCDVGSLSKVETEVRARAFEREAKYSHRQPVVYTVLPPLTKTETDQLQTVKVANVVWQGAGGIKEEPDITFSWMNEPNNSQIQTDAQTIIDNVDATPIAERLDEIL